MVGQGRPNTSPTPFAKLAGLKVAWMCHLALAVQLALATVAGAVDSTMRVRIAWGGGAERQWQGTVRLSSGTFSDLRLLGTDADEPGSIWIDDDRIVIAQRSPHASD